MSEYPNIQISGSGKAAGGRCGQVHISGSGKIQGALICDEFHVSGAGKVEDGGLTVLGPAACSGACKVEGPFQAQSLRASGAFTVEGDAEIAETAEVSGTLKTEGSLQAKRFKVSGVCSAEHGIRATEVEISGVLKTPADVQAETLRSSGALQIDGLLNAETVEIQLFGDNLVNNIGGGTVRVQKRAQGFSLFRAFKRPHLAATLIEADEIDLEYTDAQIVRGVNVRIGPECVIDRVEFSGSLSTDPNCTVREKVKI